MRARPAAGLAALVLAVTAATSGCGLQAATQYTPPSAPGSIEPIDGVEGDEIVVGAKNFTEQLILGKIAVIALQVAGFDVVDRTNIPGSVPARQGMVDGDIDMEWEYTGTAWLSYLGESEPIPDPQEQWEAVRDADAANGLTWLPPAEANNTYAFAVRSEALPELGNVSTLSGIAELPVEERTFCVESEFASRNDGLGPMLETYGIPLGDPQGVPRDNISILDTGAVYEATDDGLCNFGEVFTTDGRIPALDLTVLEDDRNFFPAYNISPVVLTETLAEYPELADVFGQITPLLTDEVLQELNARVDVAGEEPADVALDWMVSEGLVTRG
ncbi:osmoprotectant transport system substrate-binding protein [Blastococcus sp. DSM 46786]|uniref:glycine betaine ABC transporter substrate-binding protein n=1 Tax=Blastococcus sp. DSM 46786 TaxID=1798227 RepID=UPI0008C8D1F6|nr:glycine betaine ABC transporter substrate-binding protein [Blastococcus sp. DSM 46786]SEL81663.1 osmoprotectant transport system substrate-binding protein [Blastococcus sp. DSM 46786]